MAEMDHDANTQELVGQLKMIFLAPDYQPPRLPAEAMELVRLSRRPDVKFDDILTVLERDPLLAGQVLRIAQSPVYGPKGAVQSLRQALVRLGLHTLADIFFATSMNQRVFRAPGYEDQMASLRRHSTATAHVARIVSRYTSLYDEYAFLCGLLHDVGIAALIIAITDAKHVRKLPRFEKVWPAILIAHAEASATLCELWGLGPEVVLAVRTHHEVRAGMSPNEVHPLAAVVALADSIASRLGAHIGEETRDSAGMVAQRLLGLSEHALQRIEVESQAMAFKLE